jgi:hypothetical protein
VRENPTLRDNGWKVSAVVAAANDSAIFRTVDYWLWGLQHGFTEDPRRCRRPVTVLLQ